MLHQKLVSKIYLCLLFQIPIESDGIILMDYNVYQWILRAIRLKLIALLGWIARPATNKGVKGAKGCRTSSFSTAVVQDSVFPKLSKILRISHLSSFVFLSQVPQELRKSNEIKFEANVKFSNSI